MAEKAIPAQASAYPHFCLKATTPLEDLFVFRLGAIPRNANIPATRAGRP